jgi:AcrR family transcriptional regulator
MLVPMKERPERPATRKSAARKRKSARGRPPAHEVASRASNLLDAATDVFLEQGFKGASISAIARRAGASKQTLYARYPSKHALFAALIERKSARIFEAIGPLNQDRSLRETLVHFGCELLSMILADDARSLHRLVIAEGLEFPELGEMFWDLGPGRTHAMLADYLRVQQAEGTIQCGDLDRAIDTLVGLLFGAASLRTNLGLPMPHMKSRAQQASWVNYAVDVFLSSMHTPMHAPHPSAV